MEAPNTMQCNAMQCNAMQCNAMQGNGMDWNGMECVCVCVSGYVCTYIVPPTICSPSSFADCLSLRIHLNTP